MQKFEVGDRVTVRLGIHTYNDSETGDVDQVGVFGGKTTLVLANGHWGYASNAVLVRPATFLPGDRVEASAGDFGNGGRFVGTVVEPPPEERAPIAGVLVYFKRDRDGALRWARYENVTFLSRPELSAETEKALADWEKALLASSEAPARALVGPKPEPAEGPVYTAPFEAKHVYVYDASGAPVVHVLVGELDFYDRCNFAHYVANALNAAVKAAQ
jgi:hypothetical protein